MKRLALLLVLGLTFISCQKDVTKNLNIIDHEPKSDVDESQLGVIISFDKKVKIVGDNIGEESFFQSSPKINCDFKWISDDKLACYFKDELESNTSYQVIVKKGLKGANGELLKEDYKFNFKTKLLGAFRIEEVKTVNFKKIKIRFNKPIVNAYNLKNIEENLSFSPYVECSYIIEDAYTLTCKANELLHASKKYEINFRDGLKLNKGYKFDPVINSFVVEHPTIVGREGYLRDGLFKAKLVLNRRILSSKLKAFVRCEKGDELQVSFISDKLVDEGQSYSLSTKEKSTTLDKSCVLNIEGDFSGEHGNTENIKKIQIFSNNDLNTSGDSELIPTFFSSITCGNNSWGEYNKNLKNPKKCPGFKPVNFSYKDRNHKPTIKVVPEVEDFKVVDEWRGHEILGKFEFDKKYVFIVKFENEEVTIPIEFLSHTPLASTKYKSVVIEKEGERSFPLQSKNIKSFELHWVNLNDHKSFSNYYFNTVLQKRYIGEHIHQHKDKKSSIVNTPNKEPNDNYLFPIKIDDLKKGGYGFFAMEIKSKELFEKAKESQRLFYESTTPGVIRRYYNKKPEYEFTKYVDTLVTNIGLHFKRGIENSQVWVFDINTGKPLSGISIYAYSEKGVFKKLKSNDQGLVLFNEKKIDLVIAQTSDDLSFVSPSYGYQDGIGPWSFNFWLETKNEVLVESVPDRPIYKPGEKVRIKFIVRKWDIEKLNLLKSDFKSIGVLIKNNRGEKVFDKDVSLNEFSTGSISFDLESNASTGDYTIEIKNTRQGYLRRIKPVKGFKVEEYKVSPFKVESHIAKKSLKKNEEASVEIESSYFFGGSNKGAAGTNVILFKGQFFRPKDSFLKTFRFHDSSGYSYYDYFTGNLNENFVEVKRESFTLDDSGKAKINFNVSYQAGSHSYGTIVSNTSISGESGQDVGHTTMTRFADISYHLGAKYKSWSYDVDSELEPSVVLLSPSEDFVEGIEIEHELIHIEYQTTRRLGTGNYYYFDSKRIETSVGKCKFKSSKDYRSCPIKASKNGSYKSVLRTVDSNNEPMSVSVETWVHGGDSYVGFYQYNHDRIDIIPDRFDYKLGDTAELLIKSPYSNAKALVTTERYGVITSEIIDIKSNAHIYKLPIDNTYYAPGIYVSVVIIKGRTKEKVEGMTDLARPSFKMGYVKLKIKDKDLRLKVDASSTKDKLKPGEKVKLKVKVENLKDEDGPFEVALAVVDEAVLQVFGNYKKRYNIFDTFYQMPDLGISNYQTLIKFMGRQTYGKKGGTPGGGGGKFIDIRDNFLAVAYYEPHLKTDSDGFVEVEFEVPDNLTTWKVLAVANDKSRSFGLGESSFMVTKDLLIDPILPSFLNEGDKIDLRMTIHNKTESDKAVDASISTSGLEPESQRTILNIKGEDKGRVKFPFKASKSGIYDITYKALNDDTSDAVKKELEVIPLRFRYLDATFGSSEESVSIPFSLPDEAIDGTQKLDMRISSTLITGLKDSFNYVLTYPYGCWEQRTSKALMLAFYKVLKDYIGPVESKVDDIEGTVQKHIDSIVDYIGPLGGMKYYPGDFNYESPGLSTYTANALFIFSELGYKLPQKELKRLGEFLKKSLDKDDFYLSYFSRFTKEANHAQAVYVLSKLGIEGLEGYLTNLISKFDDLPLFGKGHVIRLLNEKPKYQEKARGLLRKLVSNMDIQKSKAAFVIDENKLSRYYLDTKIRSQCLMLTTMLEVEPMADEVSKLQNYISLSRNKGRWFNTQENLYCFMAMRKYASIYEKDRPSFSAKALFNKQNVHEAKLDLDKVSSNYDVDIKTVKPGNKAETQIEKNGSGRMYYYAWLSYESKKIPSERVDNGFSIEKSIYRFDEVAENWVKQERDFKVKLGDILRVRLKITNKTVRTNVGVNDPLAGALTPINHTLATTANTSKAFSTSIPSVGMSYLTSSNFDKNSSFQYMDMRSKSVQFYSERLEAGTHGLEYDVKVTSTGTFSMNASRVEEMYYPDVFGLDIGRKITVYE